MRTVFHTSKHSLLSGIALAALLTLPMACATTDDGSDPPDTESETTQKLSASFRFSCDSGSFSTTVDPNTMRVYIDFASANGCKRFNGTKTGFQTWSGRCFNDLSNFDGFLTCASG
jgi:hypothetical protein